MAAKKVYSRVVLDMTQDDMPVIESESCDYDGPWSLCYDPGENDGRSIGRSDGFGSTSSGPASSSSPQGSGRGSSSMGLSGGGWGDSPHGNPHGTVGRSMDAYGGVSSGLSRDNAHAGMADVGYGLGLGIPNWQSHVEDHVNPHIEQRNKVSRQVNPQGWKDHVSNFMDALGYALSGLGIVSSIPGGFLSTATSLGSLGPGMYQDAVDRANYRSAMGLPGLTPDESPTQPSETGGGVDILQSWASIPDQKQRLSALDQAWEMSMGKSKIDALNAGFAQLQERSKI